MCWRCDASVLMNNTLDSTKKATHKASCWQYYVSPNQQKCHFVCVHLIDSKYVPLKLFSNSKRIVTVEANDHINVAVFKNSAKMIKYFS